MPILSGAIGLGAIALAYVLYVAQPWIAGLAKASSPRAHRTLWNKYFVDEMYDAGIVSPSRKAGRVCVALDDYLIDGILWFITALPRALAYLQRGLLHGGLVQGYGLSMIAGITIIVILVVTA